MNVVKKGIPQQEKKGSTAPAGTPLVPLNEKILMSLMAPVALQAAAISTTERDAPMSFNMRIATLLLLLSGYGTTHGFASAAQKGAPIPLHYSDDEKNVF